MQLTIKMSMDNSAFEEDWTQEAGRILKHLGDTLLDCAEAYPRKIKDVNGNTIGLLEVE